MTVAQNPAANAAQARASGCDNGRMTMLTPQEVGGRRLDATRLGDVCRRFGVRELAVFGSVARGLERPDSDIDILFDLAPGVRLGFGIAQLEEELEALFGRPVDLLSKDSIHHLLRESVLSEARVLYAA